MSTRTTIYRTATRVAPHTHFAAVVVLALLLIAVLLLAPFAGSIVRAQAQAGCASGAIDAGICWAAEIGGLVTPVEVSQ